MPSLVRLPAVDEPAGLHLTGAVAVAGGLSVRIAQFVDDVLRSHDRVLSDGSGITYLFAHVGDGVIRIACEVVEILANVVVAAIAGLHIYILVLEMFLWTTPRGMRAFGTEPTFARASASLAKNQGLYNGFLAAGLIWGIVAGGSVGFQAKVFFLVCVIIAGVYGAATVNRRILFIQTVPAAIALVLVLLAR